MSKHRNKTYDYDDDEEYYDEDEEYYEDEGDYELSNSQKEKYLTNYKKTENKEKAQLGNFLDNSSKKKIHKDDTELIKKSLPKLKERLKNKISDQEITEAFKLNEYNESDTLNYLFNVLEEREKSEKNKKKETLMKQTKSTTGPLNINIKGGDTSPITIGKNSKFKHTPTQANDDDVQDEFFASRKKHSSLGLGRGRGMIKSEEKTVSKNPMKSISPMETQPHHFVTQEISQEETLEKPSEIGQILTAPQHDHQFVSEFFKTHSLKNILPQTDVNPFKFDEPSPDDLSRLSKNKILTKEHEIAPIKKKEPLKHEKNLKEPPSPSATQQVSKETRKAPPKDVEKQRINVVVIGHVDAGKSTLMGHILYDTGVVDQKTIHKFEKESQQMGKSTFHFAWVLDEQEEERQRGITMDIGVRYFETTDRLVTILDAPGHKDFIPNMINGTAQADFAILVVDSSKNAFESGFQDGGQSKEHLILARSLGISHFIVAVNKLDKLKWSNERFEEIKHLLSDFMSQIGIHLKNVTFIPCSGLAGDNLVKKSKEISWYQGPTIIESINTMEGGKRSIDKGLRISISDVFKSTVTGVTIAGKIESGTLNTNDKISIMPNDLQGQVKLILRHKKNVKTAYAGDTVEFGVVNVEINNIAIGQVVCETFDRIPITNKFRARLVTFDLDFPILKGAEVMFHYQNINIPATVYKIYNLMDQNLEVVKKKPKALIKNQTAEVQIRTSIPVCIELFNECKAFGRFMLRMRGKTCASGIVTKLSRPTKKKQ